MQFGLDAAPISIEMATELQITGVPISSHALLTEGVAKTLAPLQEKGLRVCQVGHFGYNPLIPSEQEKANLIKAMPLAKETGCPYIVITAGSYNPAVFQAVEPRNYTAQALDDIARDIAPLLKEAEKHGVYLTMEPILKAAIATPERFLALKEKVGSDALRINIDPTSLYGYWEMIDSDAFVTHMTTTLAGHYGLVHVKEITLTNEFPIHSNMVPLGEGRTDWAHFLICVAPHTPEDSWVILEHTQSAEETRNSVKMLREAAQKAGVLLA
jgi:sugar phosphate isomerase/epimerase